MLKACFHVEDDNIPSVKDQAVDDSPQHHMLRADTAASGRLHGAKRQEFDSIVLFAVFIGDITYSRMMVLVAELAKIGNVNISQLPVVGCAPEWMSEKAVSIGNYVVATGIDTYLGVEPYVSGSTEVTGLLTNGVRDWVEAAYTVEKDIDKLGDAMLARIEEKRAALGV